MSSVLQSSEQAIEATSISHFPAYSKSDLFLRNRLKVVEDLWESVLRQECGQELVDLLQQMRSVNSAEGQATQFHESNVVQLIEKLDLNAAIRAARAFALYFQLINIVEQHYEQRDQQLAYASSNDAGGRMFSKLPGQATDAPDRPRDGMLIAMAKTGFVFFNYTASRVGPMPDDFRARFARVNRVD